MTKPSDPDLELSFYETFLFGKGIEPYPVQEQAIGHIFAGKSVLVTVPTGTGKTLMAKAALHKALGRRERKTSPTGSIAVEAGSTESNKPRTGKRRACAPKLNTRSA